MSDFGSLISGFRVFKATTYQEQKEIAGHLIRQGVKPSTLFITCSDLRISPDMIFSSNPGELFVLRNVAALVPSYDSIGSNSIVAAIEYAVIALSVESIVVLGHAKCDSIKLLMDSDEIGHSTLSVKNTKAMKSWLSVANDAKKVINDELKDKTQEEKEHACEQESILVSLRNLITYPFIEERLNDDSLKLYGWHFDIEKGSLFGFDPETKFFEPIG